MDPAHPPAGWPLGSSGGAALTPGIGATSGLHAHPLQPLPLVPLLQLSSGRRLGLPCILGRDLVRAAVVSRTAARVDPLPGAPPGAPVCVVTRLGAGPIAVLHPAGADGSAREYKMLGADAAIALYADDEILMSPASAGPAGRIRVVLGAGPDPEPGPARVRPRLAGVAGGGDAAAAVAGAGPAPAKRTRGTPLLGPTAVAEAALAAAAAAAAVSGAGGSGLGGQLGGGRAALAAPTPAPPPPPALQPQAPPPPPSAATPSDFPFVLLLVGLPGSGKSTMAASLAGAPGGGGGGGARGGGSGRAWWVRINQDSSRPSTRPACVAAMAAALADRRCAIIDRCNLDAAQRADFVRAAAASGAPVHALVLDVPAHECMARAAARAWHEGGLAGPAAAAVVGRMAAQFAKAGLPQAGAEGLASVAVCRTPAEVDAAVEAWGVKVAALAGAAAFALASAAPPPAAPPPPPPSVPPAPGSPGGLTARPSVFAPLSVVADGGGCCGGGGDPQSAPVAAAAAEAAPAHPGVATAAGPAGVALAAALSDGVAGMGTAVTRTPTQGASVPPRKASDLDALRPAAPSGGGSGGGGYRPVLPPRRKSSGGGGAAAPAPAARAPAAPAPAAAAAPGPVAALATSLYPAAVLAAAQVAATVPAPPAPPAPAPLPPLRSAACADLGALPGGGGGGGGGGGHGGGGGGSGGVEGAAAAATTPTTTAPAPGAWPGALAPLAPPLAAAVTGTAAGAGGWCTALPPGWPAPPPTRAPRPGSNHPVHALWSIAASPSLHAAVHGVDAALVPPPPGAAWTPRPASGCAGLVTLPDRYPKARAHGLVLVHGPAPPPTPFHLGPDDGPLVWAMAEAGRAWLAARGVPRAAMLVGFHSAPSMQPLHMHALSADLDAPGLKTKKHFLSYQPPFFVDAEAVAAALDAGVPPPLLGPDEAAAVLRGPLRCHRCGAPAPAISALKDHLATCARLTGGGGGGGRGGGRGPRPGPSRVATAWTRVPHI